MNNTEKVTIDAESIEGVETKRRYVEVLSKVVTNTVGKNSKLKNTDKNKIVEPNVSKVNCSLCEDKKIEGGKNIHFEIENKTSDRKKNEFTPEREQKVEGKVFAIHHIDGSHESNCNVIIKSILTSNDEDLVNILVNLAETEKRPSYQ